jgi:RimJ/RimL family protein N-acetyltransferase
MSRRGGPFDPDGHAHLADAAITLDGRTIRAMADVTPPTATDTAASDPDDDAVFERRYGPWDPFSVGELRALLRDFEGTWWIVGGHAIEAFTGVARPHEDLDVAIIRRDLDALRSVVPPRYQLWAAGSGLLRPLDDEFPDLHPETRQVWLREHALAPWKVDLIVHDERDGGWVWNHDRSLAFPIDTSTWVDADGVRWARPEFVLAFKAKRLRSKNDADFLAAWPRLDDRRRTWLRATVERMYPGHPWLDAMAAPEGPVERTGATVRLREIRIEDAAIVDGRFGEPDAAGTFNDFGLPRQPPLVERLAHGRRMVGPERGRLLIERVDDAVVVGEIGWHPVMYGPNERSRALNIGISLLPEARGRGYGTEAQRLLAALLFDLFDIERVEASTDVENLAEQRSLEKAGFSREGVVRRAQFRAGAHHDLVGYSLVRTDLAD